jgi:hypothetical protein
LIENEGPEAQGEDAVGSSQGGEKEEPKSFQIQRNAESRMNEEL